MGRAPDEEELRIARRLFARALEAKGGLKIHTIHGFCERLLQRFPLESQVTPHFSVLDEREQALMRRAAFDATVCARRRGQRRARSARRWPRSIALTTGDYIRQVIDAVLGKRAELARMVAYHKGRDDWAEAEGLALKRLFGVAEHDGGGADREARERPGRRRDRRRHCRLRGLRLATRKSITRPKPVLREARASQGESRVAALERCS